MNTTFEFDLRLAGALCLSGVLAGPAFAGDCNQNGIPDKQDIASGTSLDCDMDGVPDECLPCLDPDGNGLLDPCERDLGNGVVVQYWRSDGGEGNFSERLAISVEDRIDLQSESQLPAGVPTDFYCTRWTGLIVPPATGEYSIRTWSDDGARLWIDGRLVIDEWRLGGTVIGNADIELVEGVPVSFRLDHFDKDGPSNVELLWSAPDLPYLPVPASVFRAFADADGDGWSDAAQDCDGDGVVDLEDLVAGAADCDGNCVPDECDVAGSVPTAYWRFEKGGNAILDSGPNGLDGIADGAVATPDVPVPEIPRTGESNSLARAFDDASIEIPDPAGDLAVGSRGFTIEAWVRLDGALGGGGGRQMLIQRKRFDDPDTNLEYAIYARGGNVPTTVDENFGKTSGFTGNEVVLRFGDGDGGSWSVTSNLVLPAGEWAFVSVAFDPQDSFARFGVDGVFETFDLPPLLRAARNAPVLIGAHTNASGARNQFLDGTIDEFRFSSRVLERRELLDDPRGLDCNGNGIPDACDIAAGIEQDCNGDGIPNACDVDCDGDGFSDLCELVSGNATDCDGDGRLDNCQIAEDPGLDCDGDGVLDACQLAERDCNGNGVVDACDVAAGASEDCNADGVPDECQIGGEVVEVYDDGIPENGVRSDGSYMGWFNGFEIAPGAETVVGIELMTLFYPDFQQIELHIWSDPNADGDPEDAQSIWSTQINGGPTSVVRRIDVPSVVAGPPGGRYFVGCIAQVGDTDFPASLDSSGAPLANRSWIVGSDFPIDANDLGAGAIEFTTIEQALFAGNWVIRSVVLDSIGDCNGNGVPDQCDIDAGLFEDVDGNGVPDQCEDCNMNGVPDGVDIADGVSEDCGGDGVPDECQQGFADCDLNGVPDICELDGNDCNGNTIPDTCEIAAGDELDSDGDGVPDSCQDCNGNGEVDSLDILFGDSEDCDLDGVPDECQFGTPETPYTYLHDDGERDSQLNITAPVDTAWMMTFTVVEGWEWIGAVELVWGNTFPGQPANVVIWSDPDQDGVPIDAEVLSIAPTTTANVLTSIYNRVEVPPVYIGPPGTKFFVGAQINDIYNTAPAAIDIDQPGPGCYIAYTLTPPLNLNDMAGVGGSGASMLDYTGILKVMVRGGAFDGVLPGDCNQNGVIDVCDILDGVAQDANGNGIPDDCEPCPADLDGNGSVGPGDLAIVLASWSVGGGCSDCSGDLDGDGVVGAGDLTALLAAWGPCGP